jgi:anti-anti-sigma regulatory factor
MATPITGKPGSAPKPAAAQSTAAVSAAKAAQLSSGGFSAEQLSPDSNSFPPLYEAAILYAADCYDAAQETLKEHLKTKEGKDSIRSWLMLFDLYQLTHNRKEFDALSMLFSVKFERSRRSGPVGRQYWIRAVGKRERKDFIGLTPAADGAMLGEIDRLEAFAIDMGSCRIGLEKVGAMLAEEAELFSIVFQRLRRSRIPIWFNGFDAFAAMLKKSINESAGQPLSSAQGYWSLLFELYILDGKLNEYEELGLEYAVAFEMSPPPWEAVSRPSGTPDAVVTSATGSFVAYPDSGGFPMKGVVSASSKDMLNQLSLFASSKQEVLVDMSGLLRIDFAAAGHFFEAVRAIHLGQKRVILANLNELVAALLEVFGMTKHAILMRKKAA